MKRLLFAALFLALAILACGGDYDNAPEMPTTYGITYQVECDHNFSVTYENDQGGTEQGDYSTFKVHQTMNEGDFAYISAQCDGENCEVSCQILVDGEVWKESSSSGDYVIATCSGSVGE